MFRNGVARLDAIVTVVDALRMRDEFGLGDDLKKEDLGEDDLATLVIQQIEFCNIILLNKASEISKDELGHLKAVIRAIQPKAEIPSATTAMWSSTRSSTPISSTSAR